MPEMGFVVRLTEASSVAEGSLMTTDPGYFPTRWFKTTWTPGESALLYWNGNAKVPHYMHGWPVTVVRLSRSTPNSVPLYRVRIPQLGETRTVRADQLEVPH
jgi:hypothetical protein